MKSRLLLLSVIRKRLPTLSWIPLPERRRFGSWIRLLRQGTRGGAHAVKRFEGTVAICLTACPAGRACPGFEVESGMRNTVHMKQVNCS